MNAISSLILQKPPKMVNLEKARVGEGKWGIQTCIEVQMIKGS